MSRSGIPYFQAGTVVGGLESKDKYSAIRELVHKAPILSSHKDSCLIEEAAIERERILTTGIGRGVAIAHGKTACVDDTVILLGISRHGIDFEAMDGEPVHLLFLIANPPDKSEEYLLALSTLARVMRNKTLLASLRRADDPLAAQKMLSEKFAAAWNARCRN